MSSRWYCHDCKKEWLGDEDGDNDEGALHAWETKHRVDYTFKENTQVTLTNYMDKVRKKKERKMIKTVKSHPL